MFDRVVVGIDGFDGGRDARATGGRLRSLRVAIDGSPEAREALHLGARLREELGATADEDARARAVR